MGGGAAADAIAAARDARPVEVVYEDGDLAVVWKPSGMAAVGPQPGTLQLALPHCLSLALVCVGVGGYVVLCGANIYVFIYMHIYA